MVGPPSLVENAPVMEIDDTCGTPQCGRAKQPVGQRVALESIEGQAQQALQTESRV
jgi:hypothetical protein